MNKVMHDILCALIVLVLTCCVWAQIMFHL